MLSSRDMRHSLVVGTSRISTDIHIRMIINLHIPTTLFNVFATISPPTCIYWQHFSTHLPLFRCQPAYTDSTFWHIRYYFAANLHILTTLLNTFATTWPPTFIHRQHFSTPSSLFRRKPAYTDSTFHIKWQCLIINLYIPTSRFNTSATIWSQTCICRHHVSTLVPPFHHQPAHTDHTSLHFPALY